MTRPSDSDPVKTSFAQDADDADGLDCGESGVLQDLVEIESRFQKLVEDGKICESLLDPSGRTIGRYMVRETMRQSGQANVYLAWDPVLERQVIIKLHLQPFNASQKAKLIAEGRALSKLKCANVAQCLGIEEFEGQPFLVIEYIDGKTLAEVVDENGSLDANTCANFAVQICEGLQQLHCLGLIHRDIKPDNIIVRNNQAILIDFGLTTRAIDVDHADVSGTMAFMAPEQKTQRNQHIDQRTDIYGIGATLYFAMTGTPPEGQENIDFPLKSDRSVPGRSMVPLTKAIGKCLAESPEQRFASVAELRNAILQVPKRILFRSSHVAILLAAVVILLGAGWYGFHVLNTPQRDSSSSLEKTIQLLDDQAFDLSVKLVGEDQQEIHPDFEGVFRFQLNEKFRLHISSAKDCRVTAVSLECNSRSSLVNHLEVVFPEVEEIKDSFIIANQTRVIPAPDRDALLCDTLSPATEYLLVFAWTGELDLAKFINKLEMLVANDSITIHQVDESWRGLGRRELKNGKISLELIKYRVANQDLAAKSNVTHSVYCSNNLVQQQEEKKSDLDDAFKKIQRAQEAVSGKSPNPRLAFKLICEAFPVIEKKLGRLHPKTLKALDDLALYHFILRKPKAIELNEDLLARRQELGQQATTAYLQQLTTLGLLYAHFGKLLKAEQQFKSCMRNPGFKKHPPAQLGLYLNYETYLSKLGRLTEAMDLLRKARTVCQTLIDQNRESNPNLAFHFRWTLQQIRNRYAAHLTKLGDHRNAINLSNKTLQWLENLDEQDRTWIRLQGKPIPVLLRLTYFNLGNAHLGIGEHEKAVKYFAEHEKQITPGQHLQLAQAQRNVATVLLKTGKPHDAMAKLKQAFRNARLDRTVPPFEFAKLEKTRGEIQQKLGLHRESVATLKKSIELQKSFGGKLLYIRTLYSLGSSQWIAGEKQAAYQIFCDAIEKALEHFDRELLFMAEDSALRYSVTIREILEAIIVATDPSDPEQVEKTYRYVILGKSPVTRVVAGRQLLLRTSSSRRQKKLWRELSAIRAMHAENALNKKADERANQELFNRKRQLIQDLATIDGKPASTNLSISSDDVKKFFDSLSSQQFYVDFNELNSTAQLNPELQAAIFVIAKKSEAAPPQVQMIPWTAKHSVRQLSDSFVGSLYEGVFTSKRGLGRNKKKISFKDASDQLSKIWQHIENGLPTKDIPVDSVFHLFVDGSWAEVPWSAIKNKEGKYLVQKYCFTVNDSPHSFLRKVTKQNDVAPNKFKHPVLVGDIPYQQQKQNNSAYRIADSETELSSLSNLRFSSREIQDIKKTLGQTKTTLLLRDNATKKQLLQSLSSCDLLHFSGHGYLENASTTNTKHEIRFQSNTYLKSGLVLAKSSKQNRNSDFLLTGEDLVDRNLSSLRLVVLSGCFTGNGRLTENDGIWGIQKALQLAGVHSTLSALYPVEDQATAKLMSLFYKNLIHKRMTQPRALAAAQRALMQAHPAPKYWAAWTLN